MAQFASNLEKNLTGRKRPTMAIRLDFLIENCFVKNNYLLRSQVLSSHTNPSSNLFPDTELGVSVYVF